MYEEGSPLYQKVVKFCYFFIFLASSGFIRDGRQNTTTDYAVIDKGTCTYFTRILSELLNLW